MASNRVLCLPDQYRTNPPASADADGSPYWTDSAHNDVRYQEPVYRLAARYARRKGLRTVLDVGCGSGDKLAKYFGGAYTTVGVDQPSAIRLASARYESITWVGGDLTEDGLWRGLERVLPDMVISADVIEHLQEPDRFLDRLRTIVGHGQLILSTPDRSRLKCDRFGPPNNPRHIREWTAHELNELVVKHGFRILKHSHLLPRSYSPTLLEVKRVAWRVLHGRSVPDRRSCQVVILAAS